MRRFFVLAFVCAFFSTLPFVVKAEAKPATCFDYYTFGSVEAKLSSDLLSATPGSVISVSGTLINHNSYPIVDGGLRIKVFRTSGTGEKDPNGINVVDEFDVLSGIDLPANGTKDFSFEWQVPQYALSGSYQFATFFASSKKFNLLGLSFTDDVVGNTLDFSVTSGETSTVQFDRKTASYNGGNEYTFASYAPRIGKSDPFVFSIKANNTTGADKQVPVTWKLYSWDSLSDANLISTKNDIVMVKANQPTILTYSMTNNDHAVYYLVGEIRYGDTRSIIGVRFVRDGIDQTRINFPAVTSFPLVGGENAEVFSCFHGAGTAPVVTDGNIVLTLRDMYGKIIHTSSYKTDVTGEMMGVVDDFTPSETYTKFSLSAELYNKGVLSDSVTRVYDCQTIDPKLCSSKVAGSSAGKSTTEFRGIVGLVIGLIGMIVLALVVRKKKTGSAALVVLALFASLSLIPRPAHAADALWTTTNIPRLFSTWQYQYASSTFGQRALDTTNSSKFSVTIKYHANIVNANTGTVIADGATIPVGTPIKLVFTPFDSKDIYWFATGFSGDSPYGDWVTNAAAPSGSCLDKDFVSDSATVCTDDQLNTSVNNAFQSSGSSGTLQACAGLTGTMKTACLNAVGNINNGAPRKAQGFNYTKSLLGTILEYVTGAKDVYAQSTLTTIYNPYKIYAPLSVNPPTRSITGTTDLGCSSLKSDGTMACTPKKAGTYSVTFNFAATYGKFYYATKTKDGTNICSVSPDALRTGTSQLNTPCGQVGTVDDNDYVLDIPAQKIKISFTVATPDSAPSITIGGPTTGYSNTAYSFDFTGTDPEKGALYYNVDWDNNGVSDERIPASGTVTSGTKKSSSHTWTSTGTKTFKALAKDANGNSSDWKSYSIALTAVPVDQTPVGNLDSATCSSIVGWALDKDTPATSIDVHLYKDAPAASGGTYVNYYSANVTRSDVNTAQGVTGKHGFSITTPDSLKDGKAHKLYVYGINSSTSGQNALLSGNPLSITCANAAPTVKITSPVTGSSLTTGDTVSIAATAADSDGTVSGVEFFVDGTSIGSDTTSPYAKSWKVASGSHTIKAVATDDKGATGQSTVTVTGTTLVSSVNLTVTPSSLSSAQNVTVAWTSSNVTACSATDGWSASKASSGSETVFVSQTKTFSISCSGSSGTVTSSATVTLTPPPAKSVTLTFNATPTNVSWWTGGTAHLTWSSSNALSCTASGDWDGGLSTNGAADITIYPFSSPQKYVLSCSNSTSMAQAVAIVNVGNADVCTNIDGEQTSVPAGYEGSESLECTPIVTNAAPTVAIAYPVDGATLVAKKPIVITATASDSDGTVQRVGFFVDGTSIGVDTSAPYAVPWTPIGVGSHVIKAVAVDDGGATAESSVNVNVVLTFVVDPGFCDINPTDPSCVTNNFCDLNPNDPSCTVTTGGGGDSSSGGDGGSGGGSSGGNFCDLNPNDPACQPVSGFTITSAQSTNRVPIQFLGGLGATSKAYELDINPVNGFGDDVTLSVQGTSGLPSDVTATYKFDGDGSSITLRKNANGYYASPSRIGTVFTATLDKPIENPYTVYVRGVSSSYSYVYNIIIDPRATAPVFKEI